MRATLKAQQAKEAEARDVDKELGAVAAAAAAGDDAGGDDAAVFSNYKPKHVTVSLSPLGSSKPGGCRCRC